MNHIESSPVPKRPELLVLEKSHLRAREVVVRGTEPARTITTRNSLAGAVKFCRENGYTWLNRVKPPRLAGQVQA